LSPQANLLLAELGLLEEVEALNPARLEGWRITSASGDSFQSRFADVVSNTLTCTGLAISRERLDSVLIEAARRAGANVVTDASVDDVLVDGARVVGVRARVADQMLEVSAPLTIGADGLQSFVRRKLNLLARPARLRKVALTAHFRNVADTGAFGELHVLGDSCVGLSPVDSARELSNVTLVLDAERHGRSIAGKSFASFLAHLERFPGLRGRFQSSTPEGPVLASGPFDQPTRDVVVSGAALVGDAAGYFDPFTGQGIYQAIAGGILLGQAAGTALRAGRTHLPLRNYARAHAALVTAPRRVQRGIELVVSRPALADRCIRALARSPSAAAALISVTGDVKPPRSLLSAGPLLSFLRHLAWNAA
jgi:flavin-dependent dehydrogenase